MFSTHGTYCILLKLTSVLSLSISRLPSLIIGFHFIFEHRWNPAAEMQAIDRTHRLGQYRPIRAVRFIAEGTVEERVLQLQEKKRLVFDGTIGRDAASLKMLTVNDMKALFT